MNLVRAIRANKTSFLVRNLGLLILRISWKATDDFLIYSADKQTNKETEVATLRPPIYGCSDNAAWHSLLCTLNIRRRIGLSSIA